MDSDGTRSMTIKSARAFPNIALVKYWGKRDEALMLPAVVSFRSPSMRFPPPPPSKYVMVSPKTLSLLNGTEQSGGEKTRVVKFLELVRTMAGSSQHAVVTSLNEAPTGVGLASSVSGFAALAVAAAAAYGLDLDRSALEPPRASRFWLRCTFAC